MKCPECDVKMFLVKTESHYGVPIFLDQCSQCGGLWFDESEMNRTHHDAAKILDQKKLKEFKYFPKEALICPKDGLKLKLFKDLNFPKEIVVENCHNCGGFWFNRGEFASYQKYRKEKREENIEIDKELEKRVNALISKHHSGDVYDTLGKLGKFLSTPIERGYYPRPAEGVDEKTAKRVSLIILIAMSLLRILTRR